MTCACFYPFAQIWFIHLDMQIYPPSYMFVLHAAECTWDYDTKEWRGRGYNGCWGRDVQRAKKKMRFNLFPPQVCLLFSLLLTSYRERFLRGDTVNSKVPPWVGAPWEILNDGSTYIYDPMTKKYGLKIGLSQFDLHCHRMRKWSRVPACPGLSPIIQKPETDQSKTPSPQTDNPSWDILSANVPLLLLLLLLLLSRFSRVRLCATP